VAPRLSDLSLNTVFGPVAALLSLFFSATVVRLRAFYIFRDRKAYAHLILLGEGVEDLLESSLRDGVLADGELSLEALHEAEEETDRVLVLTHLHYIGIAKVLQ
jgi:hypothetical protein